jgi:hypothetical protein
MNGPDILSAARQQLADAVSKSQPATCDPLSITPWIAMSALQKAIRRGQDGLAQRAAATLLSTSPERLWRRCGCIAFEDVGIADFDTVAVVTAALAGKRFRATLGGEWVVASYIVSRMAESIKCRASDDLLLAVENHPTFEHARAEFVSCSTNELIRIATGTEPLPIRALALWYGIGTDRRPSPRLQPRRGDPTAMFDALCEAGIPPTVVEVAHQGYRKVGEVLCPFVALLCSLRQQEPATTEDDEFPPEAMVGEVPGWSLDVYSRPGRAALQAFINGQTETAHWVRAHIPTQQRVGFLGGIVFRVEGGAVKSRLRWPTGDELRRQVDTECNGPDCHDATEILGLIKADIPALNRVRLRLNGGSIR